ncbi:MAG: MAPEG family protein [Alphaproteobacteria bacterium]
MQKQIQPLFLSMDYGLTYSPHIARGGGAPGMNHQNLPILWPTMAMALLIFVVWFVLLRQRLGHIASNRPTAETFANAENVARYFRPVERPAQNLANLFEMPVLYFALVPLLIQAGQTSITQVLLAWFFVGLRVAHSVVHIGPNAIQTRFRLYLASDIALSAMWLGFVIDLLIRAGASA